MDINNSELINAVNGLAKLDFFKYRLVTEMQRSDRLASTFCIAVLHVNTPKIKSIVYPKEVFTPYIAKAIISTIRNLDLSCKDERGDFLILLTETSDELAALVVKRIIEKLTFLNNKDIETKVSAGIANYPSDSKSIDELVQAAKFAMFQANQKDGNEIISISSIRKGLSWEAEAKNAMSSTRKKFNQVIETTIKSLLSTFATKADYLEKHSLQVSKIASMIAEKVGIKENYIHEITLAALLHDVGYLEIPDEILLKKGPLTPEEMEIIKLHPIIATKKILKPIKSFENILPIILGHHEHWDGKGYPENKFERHIHIGARILSIADAYDALTSDRPFRQAMDQQEAIKILQQGSGTIWEAKLIAAFIDILSDDTSFHKLFDN